MRRTFSTLLMTAALAACGGDASEAAADTAGAVQATEAAPAAEAPAGRMVTGLRAIDKARDAADAASQRALRHDTIR